MKKEDLDFLIELQHELNTQETDEQAAPRYWGIAEDKEVLARDGDGEPIILYDGESYTLEEFCESIESEIGYDENDTQRISSEFLLNKWQRTNKDDVDEVVNFAEDELNRDCDVAWVTKEMRISRETSCFLTKRAAKKHLEANHYHYNNGRTYAMTAWRNPEFERLLKIVQETNWNLIKIE